MQLLAAKFVEGNPGCQLHIVNTSPTDPDTVWVTEIWRSQAGHDASLTVAGAQEAIQRTLPLLAERPEPIRVIPVGGKGLAIVGSDS